jgi:hypothetical protein
MAGESPFAFRLKPIVNGVVGRAAAVLRKSRRPDCGSHRRSPLPEAHLIVSK